MKNYISLNIKYLRSENNLQQEEFATLFNVSRDAIGTYEREKSTPRLETIQQICNHFNLSIDNFVNRDLSSLPKTQDDIVVDDGDCKMCALYERIIEDKERLIRSLEREIGAYRGLDLPDEGQTA